MPTLTKVWGFNHGMSTAASFHYCNKLSFWLRGKSCGRLSVKPHRCCSTAGDDSETRAKKSRKAEAAGKLRELAQELRGLSSDEMKELLEYVKAGAGGSVEAGTEGGGSHVEDDTFEDDWSEGSDVVAMIRELFDEAGLDMHDGERNDWEGEQAQWNERYGWFQNREPPWEVARDATGDLVMQQREDAEYLEYRDRPPDRLEPPPPTGTGEVAADFVEDGMADSDEDDDEDDDDDTMKQFNFDDENEEGIFYGKDDKEFLPGEGVEELADYLADGGKLEPVKTERQPESGEAFVGRIERYRDRYEAQFLRKRDRKLTTEEIREIDANWEPYTRVPVMYDDITDIRPAPDLPDDVMQWVERYQWILYLIRRCLKQGGPDDVCRALIGHKLVRQDLLYDDMITTIRGLDHWTQYMQYLKDGGVTFEVDSLWGDMSEDRPPEFTVTADVFIHVPWPNWYLSALLLNPHIIQPNNTKPRREPPTRSDTSPASTVPNDTPTSTSPTASFGSTTPSTATPPTPTAQVTVSAPRWRNTPPSTTTSSQPTSDQASYQPVVKSTPLPSSGRSDTASGSVDPTEESVRSGRSSGRQGLERATDPSGGRPGGGTSTSAAGGTSTPATQGHDADFEETVMDTFVKFERQQYDPEGWENGRKPWVDDEFWQYIFNESLPEEISRQRKLPIRPKKQPLEEGEWYLTGECFTINATIQYTIDREAGQVSEVTCGWSSINGHGVSMKDMIEVYMQVARMHRWELDDDDDDNFVLNSQGVMKLIDSFRQETEEERPQDKPSEFELYMC